MDESLDLRRNAGLKFFCIPGAVQKECAAVYQFLAHVELADVCRVVACNEVGLVDEVGGLDGLLTESQVRHGNTAGLLGVVIKVCLCIHVGVVADDLDGVLVGTDGTVCAQTPELAADGAFGSGNDFLAGLKRQVGNVIDDAEGESLLGLVVKDSDDLCRSGVLGTKAVASAVNRYGIELCALESLDDIQFKRFADGAGLLGPVENGDLLDGLGDNVDQSLLAERSVQTDLYETDLAALSIEVINSLFDGLADRAHGDDDLLGIGSAVIVEELVVCADLCIDLVHVFLDDSGHCIIDGVAGFSGLEEQIRVLSGAHLTGMCGVKAVVTECLDSIQIDQILEVLIIPCLDLLDLVRGTESVEEVNERKFALYCCAVSNGSQVHNFLYGRFAKHSTAGLTCCINVGMIAEDVQGVCSDTTCGYVEDSRKTFAGNLVKVGDHKKEALRSGECGCHSTCCDCAVGCTGSTCLGLHFSNLYSCAEDVLSAGSCPFIYMLRHDG